VDTAGEGVDRNWLIAGIFNQSLFTRVMTWKKSVALNQALENARDSRELENSIAGFRIITIDAMGCQRAIAQKIIDKKADYSSD
jgi:hypothetical protein